MVSRPLLGLMLLLLGACSATRFVYNQMDWVIPIYVETLVTLDDAQDKILRESTTQLLRWHCQTQVPEYAETIGEMAKAIDAGTLDRTRWLAYQNQILAYWKAVRRQAAAPMIALLSTASDAQITELFESLSKQNEKFRKEFVDRPEKKIREAMADTMTDRLEEWIDDLSLRQRAAVNAWSERVPLIGRERYAWRLYWQTEFRAALALRHSPEKFPDRAMSLIVDVENHWGDAYRNTYQRFRDETIALLIDIAPTLEARQRKHLSKTASTWVRRLDGMACTAPAPAAS